MNHRKIRRAAEAALEYSKECFFKMQECGAGTMDRHEKASARCFEELLHTSLSENEIGAVLASRGYTYPKGA